VDLRFGADEIYDGTWHFAELWRQDEVVQLLLDRRVVVTKSTEGLGSVSNTDDLIIGRHALDKDYHFGNIDQITLLGAGAFK
jgi:hypothetical protein